MFRKASTKRLGGRWVLLSGIDCIVTGDLVRCCLNGPKHDEDKW